MQLEIFRSDTEQRAICINIPIRVCECVNALCRFRTGLPLRSEGDLTAISARRAVGSTPSASLTLTAFLTP
jgi:hypothetical protein